MECKAYVHDRIKRFQKTMIESGVEAAVIQKPENVFYFSNFNPVINSHPALVIIPAEGKACLQIGRAHV